VARDARRDVTDDPLLTVNTTVVASRKQVSCDVQDETVLLSLKNGEYFGLNDVGASIWRLIQEPKTVREIRDTLLDQYAEITADECEAEVVKFLREMITMELVETV
jgi:Coenzyme PQQ synthesis protein D (PqqD)